MRPWFQKSASIQPRTSRSKFGIRAPPPFTLPGFVSHSLSPEVPERAVACVLGSLDVEKDALGDRAAELNAPIDADFQHVQYFSKLDLTPSSTGFSSTSN